VPTVTGSRRALGKRATWIIADQAVSSLSNAGLSIVIARTVSPGQYGAFALAFSIYTFLVAISQSVAGQVVMIRYSATDDEIRDRANAGATGTAVVIGLASAVLLGVVSSFLQLPLRSVLLAMGVLLPGLMLQDTWRTIFVSRGTPSQAFTNDVLWIVLQILSIGLLLVLSVDQVVWYLLAWGGAALGAAIYGIRQAGVMPRLRLTKPFLLNHRDVSAPSLAYALAILGANQVAFIVIAAVASVEAVGALRGAQTLLGPLNIVGFALTAFAVPEIIRHDLSKRGLATVALVLSGIMVVVDLTWGAILLVLPEEVGVQLLGDTWPAARAALPGMVVFTAAIGATVGATAVMRALARLKYAFWTSAMLGPLVLSLSVLGAWLVGAPGAAWGFATAALLVIPPAWWLLARAVRLGRIEAEVGI
jgi:O-antigen/teichoic acid export membrane protein